MRRGALILAACAAAALTLRAQPDGPATERLSLRPSVGAPVLSALALRRP